MGRDKASLLLAGQPMAKWVADAMNRAGLAPVVALGGKEQVNLPVVPDEIADQGPLCVLVSALERLGDILVCPCDVPLASAKLFQKILTVGVATDKAIVLVKSDQLQPLIGLYRQSSIGLLKAGLETGARGPKHVLKGDNFEIVEAPAEETQNINTPEQFKLLAASLGIKNRES